MKFHAIQNRFLPMNRRAFLISSGLLGVGTASAAILPSSSDSSDASGTVKFDKERYKVSNTLCKIGTVVAMTLIHPSRDQAEQAMALSFAEIDRLEGLFNRFHADTAVSDLNRHGGMTRMPPELHEVIARSLFYHQLSRGTFDITVKPVVDLFQETFGGNRKRMPTGKELGEVIKRVGSEKIEFRSGMLRFRSPGMGITLDGIAKGYIVDQASRVLAENGVTDHLVNAGGDIRTMGTKQGKRPWTIAIQDPEKKNNFPDIIHIQNGAIATSGNYEIYYDRQKMFHHIVNPKTGFSPLLTASVSVTATSAMEADALSTSVFVMAPTEGKAFIDTLPGCECLIVTKDNKQYKSRGWKSAAV